MAEPGSRPPVRVEGAARSTLLAFLTQMATAGFTAILTVYLLRALGPREFGLFSLAASIGALLMLPSDFGITGSTARFIAERFGDPRAVAALMSDALRLKLIVSGVVSLALLVAASPVAHAYGEPSLTWPIRWMAIAVLFQSLVAFYRYAFLAMRDASVGLRIVVGEAAMETGASILLVVIAGGAAGAAAGRTVGYAFGAFLAIGLTLRRLGAAAFARSSRLSDARRRLARYAGALFAIDLAFSASVQTAPLMIGGFLGVREVGLFQAPTRLIVLLQYPGVALANGISPRMARSEDHEPEVGLFTTAMRYLLIIQALTVIPIVVWAEPIVHLVLGPGYDRSADILRILGPYIFTSGLAGPLAGALNYLGEARRRVPIGIADLVLSATLTAAGLATIGLNGAAWTADVVSAAYVAVHIWLLRRMVSLPLRPLLLTAVRALLAGAAMAAVLFAFGTHHLAVWEWVAGGLGGFAAFAAVILLSREVSIAELRALPSVVFARGAAPENGNGAG